MIKHLKSDKKTTVSRGDKVYLLSPYFGEHTISCVWGDSVPSASLPIEEVDKIEIHFPSGAEAIPLSEVFFRKCDRDLAVMVGDAVNKVYEGVAGYETLRRKHKISKRRASVTVNMFDPLPDHTKRAMMAVCDRTMGAVKPYCFTIQGVTDGGTFGDIVFRFPPDEVPNPKIATVYLKPPHGFGLSCKSRRITQLFQELSFLSFLNWCGFNYVDTDMKQLTTEVTYYSREYRGKKKDLE